MLSGYSYTVNSKLMAPEFMLNFKTTPEKKRNIHF